ncbi:hypothetical protein L7F22_004418 [Adiantum nelumboides]|nr:hypothetical protein [Adiantum nelumboides]
MVASSNMKYQHLGHTGLKVSALSYGARVSFGNQIQVPNAKVLLLKCQESDLVISTKILRGGQGVKDVGLLHKHIIEGTQACLRCLQMNYVDVFFCHKPVKSTHIEKTVRAMNFVIEKGWASFWGTSKWDAQQIMEAGVVALCLCLIGLAIEQPQLYYLVEGPHTPLYQKYSLGLTIWSPIESSVLTR